MRQPRAGDGALPVRRVGGGARSLVVAVLLAGATVTAAAPADGADFGPQQTLTASRTLEASVQTAVARDGRVHGFLTKTGSVQHEIHYFAGRAAHWHIEKAPYRGWVQSVAQDRTGTYLLHVTTSGLRVTKRLADGRYTRGHLLQGLRPGTTASGQVVAASGRWWAAWGLLPQDEQQDLYEAGTIGGRPLRARITGRNAVSDADPTLALLPGDKPRAVLVWLRAGHLWTARAARPGGWTASRRLGGRAEQPSLIVADGDLHLSWVRDGRPWYATGPRTDQLRATPAAAETIGSGVVRLAVSRGRAYIVFSHSTGSTVRLAVRSSPEAGWRTGTLWSSSYDWDQFSITATPAGATVFVGAAKSQAVLVRSQER